jgi:DDE superfamily endonuclease
MAARNPYCVRRLPEEWSEWVEVLTPMLDSRTAWRLPVVLAGMLLARGRRTVTTWLRAQGVLADFDDYYYFLGSLGRKIEPLATRLFQILLARLPVGERIVLALDDTPTRRYGPQVEGAGLHHNPTSGPDDHKFIYGHIWVTLAWMVRHPRWHTIGLPLRALLYVKAQDFPKLDGRCHWTFRTKLLLAVELVKWAVKVLAPLAKPIWVVADGAYAYRPLLREILPLKVTFVSRLRKDAGLRTLPPPRRPGQRGATRKYGREAISLAKRAAHPGGWQRTEVVLYGGRRVIKTYKTFLATWPVVGGVIRVVIVREWDRWEAFFCTDPTASVESILECFADRSSIEQVFHDIKEVWGAGEQQVRNLFANVVCYHLNLWMHTLVELWAWNKSAGELCDRSLSPWDWMPRRPSHADKRNALRRSCFHNELSAVELKHHIKPQIKKLLKTFLAMAA